MSLSKRYNPGTREPQTAERWLDSGTYHFQPDGARRVYGIDTPPPTVSGNLHLGHVFSYSQADFIARFWRMNGYNVYYPMGFDDNGLPTERLVERLEGVCGSEMDRDQFIERCLHVAREAEAEYEALWKRLGLSVDWRYTYRTIDEHSQRLAQWSFLDLYRQGLAYRQKAPVIWCPECQTAIAQAEVDDLERESKMVTLAFTLDNGSTLPIATTRPELLPACVAVFFHPDDPRRSELEGRTATTPLFEREVPLLPDEAAEREKGSGVVMCCTFGDQADVAWWRIHDLPLVELVGRDGRLLEPAGPYAGLPVTEARRRIIHALKENNLLLEQDPTAQSVRVHERCDTPVEYVVSRQWFVSLLQNKEAFLQAADEIEWYPPHLKIRYREWVQNLAWDWAISRQRFFGVPFPLWYCTECDEIILADEAQLPVDPRRHDAPRECPSCGSSSLQPETDVMDTWATSSLSPQIAGGWTRDDQLYDQVFPYSLRPQAHEIIRTWAFYTIVKSHYHFDAVPWRNVAISGWALAPTGTGKISKSRGGGPAAPMAMIEQYSADALRYWAASTAIGRDSIIDEQKIQSGARLSTKLWNVARFSQRFLQNDQIPDAPPPSLTLADRWLLSRTQRLVQRVTQLFQRYDYATAKNEIEAFFWTELADNYLEMVKKRLYDDVEQAQGARYVLRQALLATLKLLAPLMPFVTEAIYQGLWETEDSIHNSEWPQPDEAQLDSQAEALGATLVEVATAVRRYKSESNLSLAAELERLHIATADTQLAQALREGETDLLSITRARRLSIGNDSGDGLEQIAHSGGLDLFVQPINEVQ